MDVGLTDWAIVRGLCRDAGESILWWYVAVAELYQDCGIRYKGTSPIGGQHTQQSKPDGKTCLRARGKESLILESTFRSPSPEIS